LAVARIRIVTRLGPHENLILPPARTAATTAVEVQLRAVPRPITRVEAAGCVAANGDGETPGWGRDDDARVEAGPTQTTSALTHATAAAPRLIAGMLGAEPGTLRHGRARLGRHG
jgi:hypothetical protein